MSTLMIRKYQDNDIKQRQDGYYDATSMCQAVGKLWAEYHRSPATEEFIDALVLNTGIPHNKIVQSRKGRHGGTWVHPQVAIHLAQWLSPAFSVLVSQWVIERIQEESNPDLAAKRGIDRATAGFKKEGRSDDWIRRRLDGIVKRKALTSTLADHGVKSQKHYAICTDEINRGILGQGAKHYRLTHGLPDNMRLRDCLTDVQLAGLDFAETLARARIDSEETWGYVPCRKHCQDAGTATKEAIDKFLKA